MTPHIQINDDVPLPPRGGRPQRGFAAALRALDIRQSVVYPHVASGSVKAIASAAGNAIARAHKRTGHKYTQRQVVENGVTVVRVWRVA